jgi:hypothetical protein
MLGVPQIQLDKIAMGEYIRRQAYRLRALSSCQGHRHRSTITRVQTIRVFTTSITPH